MFSSDLLTLGNTTARPTGHNAFYHSGGPFSQPGHRHSPYPDWLGRHYPQGCWQYPRSKPSGVREHLAVHVRWHLLRKRYFDLPRAGRMYLWTLRERAPERGGYKPQDLGAAHFLGPDHIEEAVVDSRIREEEDMNWEKWASRVEEYLRHVEALLSPRLFIIGGGVSKKSDKFFPMIDIRTPFVPATLRNNAGIIGAAVTAEQADGHPGAIQTEAGEAGERAERN